MDETTRSERGVGHADETAGGREWDGPPPLATEAVWLEVSGRLRSFIAARVRNRDDAEDILQDVFVRVHDRLPSLESPARLHAWVLERQGYWDFELGELRRKIDEELAKQPAAGEGQRP